VGPPVLPHSKTRVSTDTLVCVFFPWAAMDPLKS